MKKGELKEKLHIIKRHMPLYATPERVRELYHQILGVHLSDIHRDEETFIAFIELAKDTSNSIEIRLLALAVMNEINAYWLPQEYQKSLVEAFVTLLSEQKMNFMASEYLIRFLLLVDPSEEGKTPTLAAQYLREKADFIRLNATSRYCPEEISVLLKKIEDSPPPQAAASHEYFHS